VVITLSLSVIRPWSRTSVEIIVGPSAERDEPAPGPNTTGRHFRRRSEPEVASAASKDRVRWPPADLPISSRRHNVPWDALTRAAALAGYSSRERSLAVAIIGTAIQLGYLAGISIRARVG
jgi:hypothetical protein